MDIIEDPRSLLLFISNFYISVNHLVSVFSIKLFLVVDAFMVIFVSLLICFFCSVLVLVISLY